MKYILYKGGGSILSIFITPTKIEINSVLVTPISTKYS